MIRTAVRGVEVALCRNGCIWIYRTQGGAAWVRVMKNVACRCRSPRSGGDEKVPTLTRIHVVGV